MKAIEKFIDIYGKNILEMYLQELLHEENDCDDDLCDDEGCNSKKWFLLWLKYNPLINKK